MARLVLSAHKLNRATWGLAVNAFQTSTSRTQCRERFPQEIVLVGVGRPYPTAQEGLLELRTTSHPGSDFRQPRMSPQGLGLVGMTGPPVGASGGLTAMPRSTVLQNTCPDPLKPDLMELMRNRSKKMFLLPWKADP